MAFVYAYLRIRALCIDCPQNGISSFEGMKLRERIGNPAPAAAYYKNTAFLRGVPGYLDGIFY